MTDSNIHSLDKSRDEMLANIDRVRTMFLKGEVQDLVLIGVSEKSTDSVVGCYVNHQPLLMLAHIELFKANFTDYIRMSASEIEVDDDDEDY